MASKKQVTDHRARIYLNTQLHAVCTVVNLVGALTGRLNNVSMVIIKKWIRTYDK